MRFFSNEAKETPDDDPDRRDEDVAAVPAQRAGSPWSDAPADGPQSSDTADEHADREQPYEEPTEPVQENPDFAPQPDGGLEPDSGHRADDLADQTDTQHAFPEHGDHDGHDHTADGPDAHDLGDRDRGDDVDLPLDDQGTFDHPKVDDSASASTDAPIDAASTDERTDTFDADPAIRDQGNFDAPQAVDPVTDEPLDTDRDTDRDADGVADHSLDGDTDRDADGVADHSLDGDTDRDTDGVADHSLDRDTDGVADHNLDGDTDRDADGVADHSVDGDVDRDADADRDMDTTSTGTDFDTPVAAMPVGSDHDSTTYASAAAADDTVADHDGTRTDDTLVEDPTPADTADSAPVLAAVPVAAAASTPDGADSQTVTESKPGSVTEKSMDTLFAESDAQGFKDRWRDVQLRFVDSPKEAAAEAASLVDEAVEKLTAGLRSQKDTLLSDSDDTEKLRIELRGYRDLLNKVLSL